jgi:4-alpha-glucanotransferase
LRWIYKKITCISSIMIKLHFYLRYFTHFGESILLKGNFPASASNDGQPIVMQYVNDEFCHALLELDEKSIDQIQYHYVLRKKDGTLKQEWGTDKVLNISKLKSKNIQVIDYWNEPSSIENSFFTAPFQKVFFKDSMDYKGTKAPKTITHHLKVKAAHIRPDEVVCLLGMGKALNNWDIQKAILLTRNGHWWEAQLNLSGEVFPLSYKYGIWNTKEKKLVNYENGSNRTLAINGTSDQLTILHDGFVQLPVNWKGAGVAVPVFSLRSEDSFGVGEFNDLKPFADWAGSIGLRLIQLLPVNDTSATNTWTDSYPYAAISAFALHPLYANIISIVNYYEATEKSKKSNTLIKKYEQLKKTLNELPVVDYEAVLQHKWQFIKDIFKHNKTSFRTDAAYEAFYKENFHWLEPYAAFCALRDANKTADFNQWSSHQVYDQQAVSLLEKSNSALSEAIQLNYFIQFHLHLQLKAATEYAHARGLAVKGDIPIGIYRYSSDAWVAPDLYNMDQQAGAPPDDFAEAGQNWGFPTYNWDRMKQDGFLWWRQRFEQMSHYFDAFRIDHILGFFRIWSIPIHAVEGILGRFVPAIPVTRQEFYNNNLSFDYDRLCLPYITSQILNELFGHDALQIRDRFLDQLPEGRYALKEAFNTQRKVEAYFKELPSDEYYNKIKTSLYRLLENVILIEEEGSNGQAFHFRFGIEKTTSFQNLDAHSQGVLKALYVDYFYSRQDDFWQKEAMEKLPTLKRSTEMLICGEDLGMVPHCVPDVMKELAILSLEIQRMPKKAGTTFFHPKDAPYLSVVTPATHDMSTIRGWWEEDRALTQRFFNEILGHWGNAPYFCEAWVNRSIIEQHIYSPAMWSIFQLQDLLGSDASLRRENPLEERINLPANPKHYWRYRMHLDISDLQKAAAFNRDLSAMLNASGRV